MIGLEAFIIILEAFTLMWAFYFVWSFIVRAKRAGTIHVTADSNSHQRVQLFVPVEFFLISYGPYALPLALHPDYGVSYPQLSPMLEMPQNTQHYSTSQ